MNRSYQRQDSRQEENQVPDALEAYVREGAQQMLAAVLEEEVTAFLGRHRYRRSPQFRGYRNGYHPARELTVGLGPGAVRVPRVAQVPQGVAPQGFHSQVVRRYQRASQATQQLFARLYLEAWLEQVFRGGARSRCEPGRRQGDASGNGPAGCGDAPSRILLQPNSQTAGSLQIYSFELPSKLSLWSKVAQVSTNVPDDS